MRLAEKTSHRDTLEVLSNLPGIKESHGERKTWQSISECCVILTDLEIIVCHCVCFPTDNIDVSRYITLFNSHLQMCVDRQVLPVASDTVDFMLSKNLTVDEKVLQTLIHKLGKQNLWLCARKVFRRECHFLCLFYPLYFTVKRRGSSKLLSYLLFICL